MAISKEESQKSAQILQKSWLFFLKKILPNVAIFCKQKIHKIPLTMLLGILFF
jgi:hypothetical protein